MTTAEDVERATMTTQKKNRTTYKTLDHIANDPRVDHIYEDLDGIWVELVAGYNWEGCSGYREDTVRKVVENFCRVEEGAPY